MIKQILDKDIIDKVEEFYKLGGCVDFKIFTIDNEASRYQTHLNAAKTTLIELSKNNDEDVRRIAREYKMSPDNLLKLEFNFDELKNSGVQIQLREFLGPQFDLKTNKPLVKGVKNLHNSYFYYDTEESRENIVNISEVTGEFDFIDSDGISGAFCGAFLEAPFKVQLGNSVYEHGKYFLDFCNLFFSDVNKIEVYKWSVNSSNYFDAGKEWWGAHFWTVYNPIKNFYIGIVASSTD